MQKIEGDYAEAFNARNRGVGHLFEGRFKAQLIDSESYVLTVARTIVLNPCARGWSAVPSTGLGAAAPRPPLSYRYALG